MRYFCCHHTDQAVERNAVRNLRFHAVAKKRVQCAASGERHLCANLIQRLNFSQGILPNDFHLGEIPGNRVSAAGVQQNGVGGSGFEHHIAIPCLVIDSSLGTGLHIHILDGGLLVVFAVPQKLRFDVI